MVVKVIKMTEDRVISKRIQFQIDKGTAQSADYIIKKAGLSPSNVISMVYAEIANTGKIPVNLQATPAELAQARLIKASYDLPKVRVDNEKAEEDFLKDDGGY